MDEFYLIRKIREVKALHRVASELKEYIDERIRQEDAEADALPDDPKDPAWDDRKFYTRERPRISSHRELFAETADREAERALSTE